MNATNPNFAQILAGICPLADTLWRAKVKADARRFTGEPMTGFGPVDDIPLDDGDDAFDREDDRPLGDEDRKTWCARWWA